MKRKPFVAGNWKMNKTNTEAIALVEQLLPGLELVQDVERVLCPPFTALAPIAEMLRESPVQLGAQNMYWEEAGAFTAEISPIMLEGLCTYVILGHSERRAYFGETDATVNRRMLAALAHGLRPILCVGETLQERESKRTADVVQRQVRQGLANIRSEQMNQIVIAYEPVWAIGTGRAATVQDASEVIAGSIRGVISELFSGEVAQIVQVLYGGSVKPENANSFFDDPEIDGALVGGASLKPDSFIRIVETAAE